VIEACCVLHNITQRLGIVDDDEEDEDNDEDVDGANLRHLGEDGFGVRRHIVNTYF
jgi:hypothetical protein